MFSKQMNQIDSKNNKEDKDEPKGQEDQMETLESTVKLERSVYTRLKLIARKKEKDLKQTLNCMVRNYVSREELFERYLPFMFIISTKNSSLYIKDEKENKIFEVVLKYKDQKSNEIIIHCNNCETDYCVHTAFALASNELGELNFKIRKNK